MAGAGRERNERRQGDWLERNGGREDIWSWAADTRMAGVGAWRELGESGMRGGKVTGLERNGGREDIWSWAADTRMAGDSLKPIEISLSAGTKNDWAMILAGMIIYCNMAVGW